MSISRPTITVTVNQRLTRVLTAEHTKQQLKNDRKVWESPLILPWNSWLQHLWNERYNRLITQQELLLSQQQAGFVWEEMIRQSPISSDLLQVAETARLAMNAWQLLQRWEVPLERLNSFPHSEDVDVFIQWAGSYQQRLTREAWLDPAQLPARLIAMAKSGELNLAPLIKLAGYEKWSEQADPQQQRLLEVLQKQGCNIEWQHRPELLTRASKLVCQDPQEELKIAARRCRFLLEEVTGQSKKASDTVIGVIVPDLQKRKSQLAAAFDEVMGISPGDLVDTDKSRHLYNISLGDALSTQAMLKTAFLILNAPANQLSLEELSRLIRSPYLNSAEKEMTSRALLDARIRQVGDDRLSPALLISQAEVTEEKSRPWSCPELATVFTDFREYVAQQDLYKKRPVVEWLIVIEGLLSTLGWPGERTLDHDEYQVFEAWQDLQEELLSLDRVSGPLDYRGTLHQLEKLASDRIFQPKTAAVPIQIMGLLESTGLQFDHLLVLGMTDNHWPKKPEPNPFLPYHLQRQEKMPHASAERELEFSRGILDQLIQSAPDVLITYPAEDLDQIIRPSPLIADLSVVTSDQIGLAAEHDRYRTILASGEIERLADNQTRSLSGEQPVSGGSGIFRDQAACPFRAYAKHRLRAEKPGDAEAGLNAAERGSLVHVALELLWAKLQNWQKLVSLPEPQLKRYIAESARQALVEFNSAKQVTRESSFQQLELKRLEVLLRDWLELEKLRKPFSVIDREGSLSISIADLQINTRIDRIDRLEDGELAVIDYKTGSPAASDWRGDRPDDPQMPLYATSNPEHAPQAVIFAKLKKGETGFLGLMNAELNDPGLGSQVKAAEEDWNDLLLSWRKTLEKLATDFVQGQALVDPKDIKKTCEYCDFHSLCRIDELLEQKQEIPFDE